MRKVLVFFLLSILLSACGTCINLKDYEETTPYGGVIFDFAMTQSDFNFTPGPVFTVLAIIDMPLSLALDTATLPYTIPVYMSNNPRGDRYGEDTSRDGGGYEEYPEEKHQEVN